MAVAVAVAEGPASAGPAVSSRSVLPSADRLKPIPPVLTATAAEWLKGPGPGRCGHKQKDPTKLVGPFVLL